MTMGKPGIPDIVQLMRRIAPEAWAEDWDNVGWLVQRRDIPEQDTLRIVLSLDPVDPDIATRRGWRLNIAHHPAIFRPLSRVDETTWATRAWAAGLDFYAAHTNLDAAPGGVNDALARQLGLESTRPLVPCEKAEVVKFVTFVPAGHVDAVRSACAEAGAGRIGDYAECAFQSEGTGLFRPLPGASPYTETPEGNLEREPEVRLDMLAPRHLTDQVVAAARSAHPYEEMAYDVMLMANRQGRVGFGRVGQLPSSLSLPDFTALVGERLQTDRIAVCGPPRSIQTVAVMGGSGGKYWKAALAAGADVYLTSEVSHHEALDAAGAGLPIIDAGHFATEHPVLPVLRDRLLAAFPDLSVEIAEEADPLRSY